MSATANQTAALTRLAALQRSPLGFLPTPLQPLRRISRQLGGPAIWAKRDDCTGLATGGNKTRKLEYLLGDALAHGCDTLISTGALQSNHARQVAAAAASAGLACHLVLTDSVPERSAHYTRVGNTQLCRILGAQVQELDGTQDAAAACEQLASDLRRQGAKPYVIPMGGSNGMGSLGYVSAFAELQAQMQALGEPLDAIVLASGSGGTQAGLVLGAQLAGWQGQLLGVSVGPTADVVQTRVRNALAEAAQIIGLSASATGHASIDVDDSLRGPHYGIPNAATEAAVLLAARQEGLVLDPVYTGKGFAGLLQALQARRFAGLRNIVFLHTGGAAAISAYPEVGAA